jgi:hypothetical protein
LFELDAEHPPLPLELLSQVRMVEPPDCTEAGFAFNAGGFPPGTHCAIARYVAFSTNRRNQTAIHTYPFNRHFLIAARFIAFFSLSALTLWTGSLEGTTGADDGDGYKFSLETHGRTSSNAFIHCFSSWATTSDRLRTR